MKLTHVGVTTNTHILSENKDPDIVKMLTLKMEDGSRHAILTYLNGQFSKCEYGGVSNPYKYADWVFIGKVSKSIQDIQCEFEITRTGIVTKNSSNLAGEIRDINSESFKVH